MLRALLLLASTLTASVVAAQPHAPSARWTVDHGERECALGRPIAGGPSATVAFRITPGMPGMGLYLVDMPMARGRAPWRVRLMPSGNLLSETLQERNLVGGRALTLSVAPDEVAALERTSAISITDAAGTSMTVALPGWAKALQSLRACERSTLAAWGVDAERQLALRSPPTSVRPLHEYVTHQDYPDAAARRGESGNVVMRLDVAADGNLTACTVVSSSGSADLDRASCGVMTRRAKFLPGRDREGRPAAGSLISRMSWRVYDS